MAGVPVLVKVATILRPIRPDLPIPDTMTRPLALKMVSTAFEKFSSSLGMSPRIHSASIFRTSLA